MKAALHAVDRAWLDGNVAHIEGLAGGKLPDDTRKYVEDRLMAVLCEALSLTVRDDDADVLAAVNDNAHQAFFNDAPAASTALSRASVQYDYRAEQVNIYKV
jgi:hypothetical protein